MLGIESAFAHDDDYGDDLIDHDENENDDDDR